MTGAEESKKDKAGGAEEKTRLQKVGGFIVEVGKVAAAITAVIAVGSAVITLYFLFKPNQLA
jgi:hypothetical protein